MKVNNKYYRSIWVKEGGNNIIQIIDQRALPHVFRIEDLKTVDDVVKAIKEMHVRGAGLIGATAAFGLYLAAIEASEGTSYETQIREAAQKLRATRPTAINLEWALSKQLSAVSKRNTKAEVTDEAFRIANEIADQDAKNCQKIGEFGLELLKNLQQQKKGKRINILTHCNAGWLAFVDHGSATAPIYAAHDYGIDVHVWVDETRPRNQGARLTAWELGQHGVPHTVIVDNAGGHLMQQGLVDMVITGSDRTTYNGDVVNKIGTYLKALAAKDNEVPFYVALPSSSFDWNIRNGNGEIPIEKRSGDEVKFIQGLADGTIKKVLLTPLESATSNYAFDITPARLISGLITEKGICAASEEGIRALFPEKASQKVNP